MTGLEHVRSQNDIDPDEPSRRKEEQLGHEVSALPNQKMATNEAVIDLAARCRRTPPLPKLAEACFDCALSPHWSEARQCLHDLEHVAAANGNFDSQNAMRDKVRGVMDLCAELSPIIYDNDLSNEGMLGCRISLCHVGCFHVHFDVRRCGGRSSSRYSC